MEEVNSSEKITLEFQCLQVTYLRKPYLVWVVCGIFSLIFVPSSLVVLGDIVMTTSNITNRLYYFEYVLLLFLKSGDFYFRGSIFV